MATLAGEEGPSGATPAESPTPSPTKARAARASSKKIMGDSAIEINSRTRRPEHCVNSKGTAELCWCPLASDMCARQSHNRDSYFAAIRQGRNDVVKFLMSPGNCEQARITDVREWLNARDAAGRCGVHAAVKYKKERILDTLLDVIKDQLDFALLVDLRDDDGTTAMLEASHLGYLRMVKTLRASGALWTHVNSEKQNARDLAVSGGHDEIVEYFDQGQDMPEDSVLHKVEDDQDEHDEEHDDHEDVLDDEEHQAPAIIAQPVVADTEAEAPMEIGGTDLEVDMQELQDRCDIIAMHATLAHFDRDATMVIAKSCILRHYRRNDVILAPEANSAMRTSLYFVLSGEVRVQKLANDRHDVLLEEGDTYGDMALLLGQDEGDVVTANKDCYVMFVTKTALEPLLRESGDLACSIAAALGDHILSEAKHGKVDLPNAEGGEYEYGKELEARIFEYYEIPVPEVVEEVIDNKTRKIQEVPLLDDVLDGLSIKMLNTHDFRSDSTVKSKLQRACANADEEHLYHYIDACQELDTHPLNPIIFQIRHTSKVLDLQGMQVTSRQALALSAALTYMRNLEGVDLSNNPVHDEGCLNVESVRCCGIVNSVVLNESIKTLILSRARITAVTAVSIGSMLAYHGTITKLDLSGNPLGDQGIMALAKGLASSLSVKNLNLANTKGTFVGGSALGDMFRSNQVLQIVNLSWNNLLSKGTTAVLEGMQNHPALEEVHMEWNLLGHTGGVAFGQLLQRSKTLARIDVSHCSIPESAVDAICAGLANNRMLENVRLQFNPLRDGVPRIKDAVFSNKNWSEKAPQIRLDHCEFDVLRYSSAVVNSDIPTGHYRFDVSIPSHRMELEKLVILGTQQDGENWRNESLDGVRFLFPRGKAWAIPPKGIVELDFVHLEKSEDQIMPEKNFKLLMSMLNQAVSPEVRVDLIKQVCTGYRISGDDAMALLYSLNRTREREEALMALFSKLSHRATIMPKILLSCFNRKEVEHVQRRLGTYYVFDAYRPEGRYRFDIGKKNELDALLHLIDLKQKIKTSVFKFCRLYPLSSTQLVSDWQSIDRVEDFLAGEALDKASGHLELEFSIPQTQEAKDAKRAAVESALAQLEGQQSPRDDHPMSLADFGFDLRAGEEQDDGAGAGDDIGHNEEFDFDKMMNRTRTEYKLVTILHPEMAGVVQCSGMEGKPFNSRWDGGKTTIVCTLEEVDHKRLVQVLTPRGTNLYTSVLIEWNSPFKTELNIGKVEKKEDIIKRETSAIHQGRLKKFAARANSPVQQRTVPKKGGKGLKPVAPETFSGVKSLDFGQAIRRSHGVRMYRPWAGFVRNSPADFKTQHVNLKAMSQHKDPGGIISKKLIGELGPSSCVNFEMDLSFLVSMHTVPRFFSFQLTSAVEMELYVSTRSLPWENDYIWKGEGTEGGQKLAVVRPTDRNFLATKYYVSVISGSEAGEYECFVEISPYQSSLKHIETVKLPRFASTKASKMRTGLALPQKVADLTSQNSKAGKILSSLMNFTEERKSKSCFGAAVPGKALMTIRGQGGGADEDQHSVSKMSRSTSTSSALSARSLASSAVRNSGSFDHPRVGK